MSKHDIYAYSFGEMYKLYLAKIERKGRNIDELNQVISWLSGYSQSELSQIITTPVDMREFFSKAPSPHPNRVLIKGSICGVKIEEIEEPIMKEIRYLDKLVDELANGKAMEKILRQ